MAGWSLAWPTMALRATGDLISAHRRRLAQAGTQLQPLRSSWIDSMSYANGVMVTQTKRGGMYGHEVPEGVYAAISHSPQPGAVFNQMRKARRLDRPVSVEGCSKCGRVYSLAVGHQCATHKPATGRTYNQNVSARRSAAARLTQRVIDMLS